MPRRRKRKQPVGVLYALLLAVAAMVYYAYSLFSVPTQALPDGHLTVTMLDVGQADSILVRQGTAAMLIDAGKTAGSRALADTLRQKGIQKLDVLVGTHPHEDHIGGLDAVMDEFEVDTLYMPKVSANTKTFESVLEAMARNGLKATAPKPGDTFTLGEAEGLFLSPAQEEYQEVNNASIVLRLTFGRTSFVFTGDAEELAEEEMLASGLPLSADVLKVGHHGSHSSSTPDFLDAVNPKIALISAGKDNSYGHPHVKTLRALQQRSVEVYRTDELGEITVTSDGQEVVYADLP